MFEPTNDKMEADMELTVKCYYFKSIIRLLSISINIITRMVALESIESLPDTASSTPDVLSPIPIDIRTK